MDTVEVNKVQGANGNTYTKAISNDRLTNDDFLKLMIEEIKNQDPTKPMDSKAMLNSQLQMSAINTNKETIAAMKSMSTSFHQSALASATSLIGKNVENGEFGENGVSKAFTVRSIENNEGEVSLKVQQIQYMKYGLALGDENLDYNSDGELFNKNGEKTGNKVLLESPGVPSVKDGKLQILNKDNEFINSDDYKISVSPFPVYAKEIVSIPLEKVKKVF